MEPVYTSKHNYAQNIYMNAYIQMHRVCGGMVSTPSCHAGDPRFGAWQGRTRKLA
jgi:hypothetical protein